MTDLSMLEVPLTFRTALEDGEAERKLDTLNLLPYAEALGEFIQQCETPISIGIQGERGTGKTTLLNMLRGSGEQEDSGLLRSRFCKAVNFETWPYAQFNNENDLAIACLHALTGKLGDAVMPEDQIEALEVGSRVRKAKENLEHVLRHVHTGIPTGPFRLRGTDGSRDIPPHRDVAAEMIAFRREFGELVKLWAGDEERNRVVFFVDDLDRVRPVEAVILLEAIRHFVYLPGCVFIFTVGCDVVQRGVAHRQGPELQQTGGRACYDRLIQVPFTLPDRAYRLDHYILDLLARSGLPLGEELAADPGTRACLVDVTLCTVGRNPRNIKRAIHYARLLEKILRHGGVGEVTAGDARFTYAMACMRIAWPELYDHLMAGTIADTVARLEHEDVLEAVPRARQLCERHRDPEKLKNNLSMFFGILARVLEKNGSG